MPSALVWTAFFFHAPGLWLFHGARLGPSTARRNVLAVAMTLAAMAASLHTWGGLACALAWAIGHVAWGAWLAARVRAGRLGA